MQDRLAVGQQGFGRERIARLDRQVLEYDLARGLDRASVEMRVRGFVDGELALEVRTPGGGRVRR